jgi:hypothetical protein
MNLNNIKEHYFTGLDPVYLLKIDTEPMGFVFNNPLDNVKTLTAVFVEKLKANKPHYEIEFEDMEKGVIVKATSPGSFYNNYYHYKIYYEELKEFHLKSQKDNVLYTMGSQSILEENHPTKRKRTSNGNSSLKFELETQLSNGDILIESTSADPPDISGSSIDSSTYILSLQDSNLSTGLIVNF